MSHVSESRALQRVRDALREIEKEVTKSVTSQQHRFAILDLVNEADRFAATLESQVHRGIHTNPPLVIFGNPPLSGGKRFGSGATGGRFAWAAQMSRDVHELRYTHLDDNKSYKHVFESGDVEMYAIIRGPGMGGKQSRDVLLTGGSGQPLWKDFD